MSRAIAATFWPRGRRALRARRPRGPNVKKIEKCTSIVFSHAAIAESKASIFIWSASDTNITPLAQLY